MAELSYPSPTYNSRNVTDAEYEKVASMATDSGVHGSPTGSPVVTAGAGLQVLVKAGFTGNVRGFAWESGASDVPLTIDSNASGSTRYDIIVLRLDRTTWNVRAAVVKGTTGSGDPTLTQGTGTTGTYEVAIARVTVLNGAASVTVEALTTYIGSRVRAANDGFAPPNPATGEIQFRPNTGQWRGYDGTKWNTIFGDSGYVTLTAGFSTWNHVYANVGRRIGDRVSLRIWVRRTGSTFSENDATGSHLATVPAELRPSLYDQFFTGVFTNNVSCRIRVMTNGEVWALDNDGNVTVGRDLAVTCNYFV